MTVEGTTHTRISVTRRTARWDPDESVTVADAMDFWAFAAGAANVIMQLARPGVGHGVVESPVDSGNLLKHPWKRARTTFSYLAVAILGNDEDRAAFRTAVDAPTGRSAQDRRVRCATTPSTVICRCGSRHACSSGSKTPINCCAAR